MEFNFNSLILFHIIFLAIVPFITYGVRNYAVVMEYCNCSVNSKYANSSTCYIDHTIKPNAAYIDVQIHRELTKIRFSIEITLIKNKNERHKFLQLNNNDGCKFFEGKALMVLVRSARDILSQAGKLPKKCPIEKDFHFLYKNLRFDAERFPPFLPKGEYDILLNITEGKDLFAVFVGRLRIITKL